MLRRGDEPIAGYTLEKFLGKGTFGEVWQASAPFGVKVALKFIDVSGKAGLKEFRGIQRVKDIRHAHLMSITAIWLLDEDGNVLDESAIAQLEEKVPDPTATMSLAEFRPDGRRPTVLVVAMLLADMSLADRMEETVGVTGHGIPSRELLEYMEQAARGLDYLNLREHDIGGGRSAIQHCDIKPENMMLVGDSVVICDFGLAQLLGDAAKTTTGMMGTPAYIAPEVLKAGKPSSMTDQYSFACSYFHLRTGNLPFGDASSLPAVLEIHKSGKLDFHLLEGSRERSVLKRATSVDPAKRYGSNLEFVRELRRAIEEDGIVAAEGHRVQLRQLSRYAAVLLIGVLLVGGGGYAALTIFRQDDSSGTTTTTGGGVRTPFAAVIGPAEEYFQSGDWPAAFSICRRLQGEYADDAAAQRVAWLTALLAEGRGLLNAQPMETEEAEPRYQQVLVELKQSPPIDDQHLELASRLGLARLAAGEEDWEQVRLQLDPLRDARASLPASDQWFVEILDVLQQAVSEPRRLFEREALVAAVGAMNAPSQEGEDSLRNRLETLKIAALADLEPSELERLAGDDLVEQLYGELIDALLVISQATRELESRENTPARLDELRGDLEAATREAGNNLDIGSRARFLLALIDLHDPRIELGEAVGRLPETFHDAAQLRAVGEQVLRRAEQAVWNKAALDPRVSQALERLVEVAARLAPRKDAARLATQARALTLAADIVAGAFDAERFRAECDQLRRSTEELSPELAMLVDACWAECAIIRIENRESVGNSTVSQISEIYHKLAPSPPPGPAGNYIRLVLARIVVGLPEVEAQLPEKERLAKAITNLQPVLADAAALPMLLVESRKAFAGALLIGAASQLQQASESQISEPAYTAKAADVARTLLGQAAEKLGIDRTELKRGFTLTNYYASQPDYAAVLRGAASLELDLMDGQNGQLLLVRALAASSSSDSPLADKVQYFSELLLWSGRHASRDSRTAFYQQIVTPALSVASQLEQTISNAREPFQTLDVSRVPEGLRPGLALIYKTSASLVEDHFDLARDLFPDSPTGAVEHRYFQYRLAAALAPEDIENLVGQYWALREWDDLEYNLKVREMFELARQAYALAPTHPATNAMQGEALLTRARGVLETSERRKMLQQAIEVFNVGLAGQDQRIRENYFWLRSTAGVELAFLLDDIENKTAILETALNDAREASRFLIRRSPESAHLAWGNAAEDLAFYCRVEAARNYDVALNQFSRAVDEAKRLGRNPAQGWMSLGRARLRRIWQIDAKILSEPPDLKIADEIATAIGELEQAISSAKSDEIKAESLFWISKTYQYQARLAPESDAAQKEEAAFKETLTLAGRLTWPLYQLAFAQRAYAYGRYETALQESQKIVAQRGGDKYVVHWNIVYEALKLEFLCTPPPQRTELIRRRAEALPADDASAAPYRVQWLLLPALQFAEQVYTLPYYLRGDVRLAEDRSFDIPDATGLAREAQQLARSHNLNTLETHAAAAHALASFRAWYTNQNRGELLNTAAASVTETARLLKNEKFENLPEVLLNEFFQAYAYTHWIRMGKDNAAKADKNTVLASLRDFENATTDANTKNRLTQLRALIDAL